MNIILENHLTEEIKSRYLLLELDTFEVEGRQSPVKAYALIDHIGLNEINDANSYVDLHRNLIKNYHLGKWSYCEQAIEHLMHRWDGELKSFYEILLERIQQYKNTGTPPDWTGNIIKTHDPA